MKERTQKFTFTRNKIEPDCQHIFLELPSTLVVNFALQVLTLPIKQNHGI